MSLILALAMPLKLLPKLPPDEGVAATTLDGERFGCKLDRVTEDPSAALTVAKVDDSTVSQLGILEATTPLVKVDTPADVKGARNDDLGL